MHHQFPHPPCDREQVVVGKVRDLSDQTLPHQRLLRVAGVDDSSVGCGIRRTRPLNRGNQRPAGRGRRRASAPHRLTHGPVCEQPDVGSAKITTSAREPVCGVVEHGRGSRDAGQRESGQTAEVERAVPMRPYPGAQRRQDLVRQVAVTASACSGSKPRSRSRRDSPARKVSIGTVAGVAVMAAG